ncbi:unnamed protein product, partial [Symbiodinium sp. CCMP2592]
MTMTDLPDLDSGDGIKLLDLDEPDREKLADFSSDDESEMFFEPMKPDGEELAQSEAENIVLMIDEGNPDSASSCWRPGKELGKQLGRGQGAGNFQTQTQMILCNVFFALRRLPRALLQEISRGCRPTSFKKAKSLAADVAGQLTRVAGNSIRGVVSKLRRAGWQIKESEPVCNTEEAAKASICHSQSESVSMQLLVTEVLANAAESNSDESLLRRLCRLQDHGFGVGEKLHSTQFFQLVEHLAAAYVKEVDAGDLSAPLPGIGIKSHFSLIFDIVSLGRSSFSRHESLVVTGISFVSPTTGMLHTRLLGAPSVGGNHTGEQVAAQALLALESHPSMLNRQTAARRLAAIGGDGAMVAGGDQARHKSTKAAKHLW